MLELPQFAHRDFFMEQEHLTLGRLVFPGVSYQSPDLERPRPGLAPRLGQHNREVLGDRLQVLGDEKGEGRGARLDGAKLDGASLGRAKLDGASPTPTKSVGVGLAPPSAKPLAGVRIVDFSWVMAGPICTKYLAAMGAEVIKIESQARPDLSHRNPSWEEINPGKRSITLNLKDDRARGLARKLIQQSDIVIENFSTGVMERLGLGYQALRELNPRIVMASASGSSTLAG